MSKFSIIKSSIFHKTYNFRIRSRIPHRRGADPPRGTNIVFCKIFQKNCMKLRTFWAIGGAPERLVDPPMNLVIVITITTFNFLT